MDELTIDPVRIPHDPTPIGWTAQTLSSDVHTFAIDVSGLRSAGHVAPFVSVIKLIAPADQLFSAPLLPVIGDEHVYRLTIDVDHAVKLSVCLRKHRAPRVVPN